MGVYLTLDYVYAALIFVLLLLAT